MNICIICRGKKSLLYFLLIKKNQNNLQDNFTGYFFEPEFDAQYRVAVINALSQKEQDIQMRLAIEVYEGASVTVR